MTLSMRTELHWVLALIAACSVAFLAIGSGGWPGAAHECIGNSGCYCEAPRGGLIAQPSNTWSCLGWLVAALWMARDAARRREQRPTSAPEEPPFQGRFFSTLYILVAAFVGVGGIFFHASLTDWGGKVDIVSMYLLVGFWILYDLTRLYGWSRRRFVVVSAIASAILLIPRLVFSAITAGLAIFGALILVACLSEALIALPRSVTWAGARMSLRADRGWLAVGLGSFALAHLVQLAVPCDPTSLLQGHALLHVIEVGTLVALYLHLSALAEAPER